jgi:ribulose-5-phosphate 4-epimerase/fuculose-1-phosphate aldolase
VFSLKGGLVSEFSVLEHAAAGLTAAPISDAEMAVRRDLAACYRLVAMKGWDDLVANHLTARVPGEPDAFLINPFGMLFEEVTASNLVKINLAGEILTPTPFGINKTGFVIHSAVHEARPDAACVIHLHSPDGVAVSMVEGGLLPLNQTAMMIAHDIAFHEYEGVALDLAERARLAADLGTKHLMLLRNHGILTLGTSVGEAFARAYFLEWACNVQVRAFSMRQPLHHASPEVVQSVAGGFGPQMSAAYAEQLLWPAMLRKVERDAPDYKL